MFRLSVIDECSYCLEQSYLCDVVDMVMPHVFIRKNREGKYVYMYVHTQIVRVWYMLWTVLPGEPGIPGDHAEVHMEEGHRKNVYVYIYEMVEECS